MCVYTYSKTLLLVICCSARNEYINTVLVAKYHMMVMHTHRQLHRNTTTTHNVLFVCVHISKCAKHHQCVQVAGDVHCQ